MSENKPQIEKMDLVEAAIRWLSQALPSGWDVKRSTLSVVAAGAEQPRSLADDAIDLVSRNGSATLVVEVKRAFSPRDVERLSEGLPKVWRTLTNNTPLLVIAEWLSPRTRELLEEENVNYFDITGNVLVRLEYPTVFIRSTGASKAPRAPARGLVRLRGPKAGRVIRFLVDVRPPYGVREIALASGVAVSYVSRLLDSLDSEALVERGSRNRIEQVDIARVLRSWAEAYDVFKTNQAKSFLAPKGTKDVMERVWELSRASAGPVAITGSFAAVRLAPVAAPRLLMLYAERVDELSASLNMLPAEEGANVVLLEPYDSVVWEGNVSIDGQRFAAPSQAAVDCLTGNGRMPAEGEALISWMVENQESWRTQSLDQTSWS